MNDERTEPTIPDRDDKLRRKVVNEITAVTKHCALGPDDCLTCRCEQLEAALEIALGWIGHCDEKAKVRAALGEKP